MNSKIFLLSIAVVAVGLFAIPDTLSLFAGQHTFYNGSEVNCAKCHQDIIDEATRQAGSHSPHADTIFAQSGRAQCEVCHTTGNLSDIPLGKDGSGSFSQGSKSLSVTKDEGAHAAVKVECVSCHDQVPSEITGKNATHGPYYNESYNNTNGFTILKGSNEACVGCHTHVVINVTWKRPVGYDMVINSSEKGAYVINITGVNATKNTSYSWGQ